MKFMSIAVSASFLVATLLNTVARAESVNEVLARVEMLEKENAAIKKENEALRRGKQLREQNIALVKRTTNRTASTATAARVGNQYPRDAYAADMPIYTKAAVSVDHGILKLWGEGGAIWSGGDPIYSFYNRTGQFANVPEFFALTPKPGWEAAAGFDYRFAASAWHISGQVRYGEASTSASRFFAQNVIIPAGVPFTVTSADNPSARLKETHGLADLALGRDVIGSGPDAMQLKFGVRVAEWRADLRASNPRVLNVPGTLFASSTDNVSEQNRFLGAGPRVGVDGSVAVGRGWALDYLGDVAALFGSQKFQRVSTFDNVVIIPPIGTASLPIIDADQKFATVFNADIQVGVSYWMTQNMKVSASYRLDAFFNVFSTLDVRNDPTKLQRMDRYVHGPRLAVSAQF